MQHDPARRKRWFVDDDFDLFVWESPAAEVLEFQLSYERNTSRERTLSWKRARGYAHYHVDSGESPSTVRQAPVLRLGGTFGGWRIRERLHDATSGLDPTLRGFLLGKVGEYCDPPRRFLRRGRRAPDWLRRLRTAQARTA